MPSWASLLHRPLCPLAGSFPLASPTPGLWPHMSTGAAPVSVLTWPWMTVLVNFCRYQIHICCSIIAICGFVITPSQEIVIQRRLERDMGCGHTQVRTRRSCAQLTPWTVCFQFLSWVVGKSPWEASWLTHTGHSTRAGVFPRLQPQRPSCWMWRPSDVYHKAWETQLHCLHIESKHITNMGRNQNRIHHLVFPGGKHIYKDNWAKKCRKDLGASLRTEFQQFSLHVSFQLCVFQNTSDSERRKQSTAELWPTWAQPGFSLEHVLQWSAQDICSCAHLGDRRRDLAATRLFPSCSGLNGGHTTNKPLQNPKMGPYLEKRPLQMQFRVS